MANFTFDELLAKREQRKADKLKVTEISVPNSDKLLRIKKPTEDKMLSIYGEFDSAFGHGDAMILCGDKALYHCCDQLQDPKLHESLGVSDPLDVVPALFTIPERSKLTEQLFIFLGLLKKIDENESEEEIENPVKN